MLGRRKKKQTTAQTELLTAVYHARDQWHYAAQIETLAVEVDEEMQLQTKIQQAKFNFLYRQARAEKVKGHFLDLK